MLIHLHHIAIIISHHITQNNFDVAGYHPKTKWKLVGEKETV